MSLKGRICKDENFNVYIDKLINNATTIIVNYGELSVLIDMHRSIILHVKVVTVDDSIIPNDSPSNR